MLRAKAVRNAGEPPFPFHQQGRQRHQEAYDEEAVEGSHHKGIRRDRVRIAQHPAEEEDGEGYSVLPQESEQMPRERQAIEHLEGGQEAEKVVQRNVQEQVPQRRQGEHLKRPRSES